MSRAEALRAEVQSPILSEKVNSGTNGTSEDSWNERNNHCGVA